MEALLIKTLFAFHFWQFSFSHSHQPNTMTMSPVTHTLLLSGHVELFYCNDMWLCKSCLLSCGPRAGQHVQGHNDGNVEEIRFRPLDPAAKLSSWHCTSVWTLIDSSGSGIVLGTEHGWGKKHNNKSSMVFSQSMLSLRPNSEVQEAIKKTMAGTRVILWDSSFADGRCIYTSNHFVAVNLRQVSLNTHELR